MVSEPVDPACVSELMKPLPQSSKTPFVIITGLSGSGKGTVLKAFEDMGYFCVDNLPVELVVKFAELSSSAGSQSKKAAIVIDVREGAELSKFPAVFRKLKKSGLAITLIYLEASEDSLIRRYSETRRPHPLTQDRPISVALDEERRRLEPIQKLADTIIDTTQFNVHELRRYIADKFHAAAVAGAATHFLDQLRIQEWSTFGVGPGLRRQVSPESEFRQVAEGQDGLGPGGRRLCPVVLTNFRIVEAAV